jgi:hypothetical protein
LLTTDLSRKLSLTLWVARDLCECGSVLLSQANGLSKSEKIICLKMTMDNPQIDMAIMVDKNTLRSWNAANTIT